MYQELKLSEIKAKGWVENFIKNQSVGMTGNMDKIGFPFSLKTWEQKENTLRQAGFLGGVNSKDDSWTPFEQNGYWIDGMIRAGRLINDRKLIDLAGSKIYPAIEKSDEDGFIGPRFLKDNLSWPHAVFFRALTAEYSATGDKKILEALKKHFLRKPLTDVYKTVSDWRIITVRNVADIETALWIYNETKDQRFLKMAEDSYAEFNRVYADDSVADENSKMKDLTLKGMLSKRPAKNNHGVTYCEICKLGAILYKYTKKDEYKKASINAFDKLYRDNMLIDGVISSSEYLNGNSDSYSMHETCDVSDFTWAVGYLYMITGEAKYGDWVENAIFNAGLGCVDDDFKGNQYFSCPNQVICDDTSNHLVFFRGKQWNSFAPKELMACCAGNVHRFMPNYVARSWMKDENSLAVFTYCPTDIDVMLKCGRVKIEEKTLYPFENVVEFTVKVKNSLKFDLVLRKPNWALSVKLCVNGKVVNADFSNNVFTLSRVFDNGDKITLSFEDKIELIENANGVSVKKGALLYCLPVNEKVVVNGLRDLNNKDFPHYSLYPDSKWNYGISLNSDIQATCNGKIGENPWRIQQNPLRIKVKGNEIKNYKLVHVKKYKTRFNPRGISHWEVGDAVFTPKVKNVKKEEIGESTVLTLVPYCTTRLRIAIFPKIN